MVKPDLAVFKLSEKVGSVVGKAIRYTIVCGIIIFMGGKLGGYKPSHPL